MKNYQYQVFPIYHHTDLQQPIEKIVETGWEFVGYMAEGGLFRKVK